MPKGSCELEESKKGEQHGGHVLGLAKVCHGENNAMLLINCFLVYYLTVQDDHTKGCKCPPGFKGDGVNSCEGNSACITLA